MIVKLQYKTFEPGEFVDERSVTYEEAIKIIEAFPWAQEREKIIIGLTNPSVTFQSNLGDYLKFALYYNGKFALHFFDGRHLFTKSFLRVDDAYPFIKEFFEKEEVDETKFHKESTPFKNLAVHFVSQDFRYTIAGKSFFQIINPWTKCLLAVDAFFLFLLINPLLKDGHLNVGALVAFLMMMTFFGGINLLLLLNYYRHTKNDILQLSKGANFFLYGEIDTPTRYEKENVQQIIIKRNDASRCQWNNFSVTQLLMQDGSVIQIPSTILEGRDIAHKFPECNSKEERVFIPFY